MAYTYAEIEKLYNSLPNRRNGSTAKRVPSVRHTTIDCYPGVHGRVYEIAYCGTVVVRIGRNEDGDVRYTVHNGGYVTCTTRRRINEYAPPCCYIEKGTMYYGDAVLVNNRPVHVDRKGAQVAA